MMILKDNKYNCPAHLIANKKPVQEKIMVNGKYNPYQLDEDFFQIFCKCNCESFYIYISDYPSVKCTCTSCNDSYLIYDVRLYPAATALPKATGKFEEWKLNNINGPYSLFPCYTYGEDSKTDLDLDWFVLVAKDIQTGKYFEVMSDETA
jgi:hypothetical protein